MRTSEPFTSSVETQLTSSSWRHWSRGREIELCKSTTSVYNVYRSFRRKCKVILCSDFICNKTNQWKSVNANVSVVWKLMSAAVSVAVVRAHALTVTAVPRDLIGAWVRDRPEESSNSWSISRGWSSWQRDELKIALHLHKTRARNKAVVLQLVGASDTSPEWVAC